MTYKLRDYQQEAVDACLEYLSNNEGNPLIVAPTGAGKSLIIAALFKEMIKYDGMRAMMVTHVKELIEQNYSKVKSLCPEYSFGIYSAGLGKRDATKNITFASIQSVYKRAKEFGAINLIIIDEAHLLSPEQTTRYQVFINALREINPRLRIVGLTATPYRTKEGMIIGKGLFDDVCYQIEIPRLIAGGYLAPLISKGGVKEADMSGVKITAGDYNEKQMSDVFRQSDFEHGCIEDILKYGQTRKSWLLFCCDLQHAKDIQSMLLARDISCGYIDGKMSKAAREKVINDFKTGVIKALCNVGVLTTGFDHPYIDMVVLLRATVSTTLYVQMCGRGMRVADGKDNCLILDFGMNIVRHGAIDNIVIKKKEFRAVDDNSEYEIKKQPLVKCPQCHEHHHPRSRICPYCGYQYPTNIEEKASEAAILSADEKPRVIDVQDVIYARHTKVGSPDSMRVTYVPTNLMERAVSEWVCLEHTGYAGQRARLWWNNRSEFDLPPALIDEALERASELRKPLEIEVNKKGKYDEIIGYLFETEDV